MNRIRDNLWVTDISTIRTEGVDADTVVTVCQDEVSDNVGCDYEHFNMADGEAEGYGGECSYRIFREAATRVVRSVENGNKTVVHCHMGQSRAPSVATAAVGVLDDKRFDVAYATVEDGRPQTGPNMTLLDFAKEYIEKNR